MVQNAALRSFLFTETLTTDFAAQLAKMLNNHPERTKVKISLRFKTGEGPDDYVTKDIFGFVTDGNGSDGCVKIESKIRKIKLLDGFETITADVQKISDAEYLALINFE